MRWAWELLYIFRKFSQRESCLSQRHKIVLAHTLEDEKYRGCVTGIGDQMRAARPDGIGVAGAEPHLLLGLAQEQAEASLQDVERILDIAVAVPRHVLVRRDLDFGDAETGASGTCRACGCHIARHSRFLHRLDSFSCRQERCRLYAADRTS